MLSNHFSACKPLACVLCCMTLAACGGTSGSSATQTTASSAPARTEAQIGSEMEAVLASLVAEIGTPLAIDPAQCRAVRVGAKACGGPSRYLVYSTQASNEERVRSLAQTYSALEQERNALSGAISTCSVVMPPAIELAAGRCQAK